MQALHKHLFQDVFEWAGHLRHETFTFDDGMQASMPAMHKAGGKDFAIGNEIDRGLQSLMSDLESRDFLRGLDRETFSHQAAEAFAQINSIHPFREGKGRTQREFFAALAERAGYPLEFGVISAERMAFVSIAAHEDRDLAPCVACSRKSRTPSASTRSRSRSRPLNASGRLRRRMSRHGTAPTWQRPSRGRTIAAGSAARPARTS
ncbi:hypothetical protein DUT91_23735 [Phyllobacterium salinisoli]|uniref:protein adenylyltransferase n=1 Tax=Phyllobacterium salinisoli TaxID=1899321 RepID=A0A368JWD9_9HYPH|nr:hypothetical protein DUT91_23735 [Phyllobacterium salinisoli]